MSFEKIERKIDEIQLFFKRKEVDSKENGTMDLALPNDYELFLFKYGGSMVDCDCYFPVKESNAEYREVIDLFYGADELKKAFETYQGRMPSSVVPIGGISGGDQLCLGIKAPFFNKVFYWYHENELLAKQMIGLRSENEEADSYWENIVLLAESFEEFIGSFKRI